MHGEWHVSVGSFGRRVRRSGASQVKSGARCEGVSPNVPRERCPLDDRRPAIARRCAACCVLWQASRRRRRSRPVPSHTEAAPSAARARDSVSEFAAYPVGFTKQSLRVDAMRNTLTHVKSEKLVSRLTLTLKYLPLGGAEPGSTARGYTHTNVARAERATPAGRLRIGSTLGLYTTLFLLIDQ